MSFLGETNAGGQKMQVFYLPARSKTFRIRMDYYSEMYTVESLKSDWTKGFKELKKQKQK